MKIAVVGAGTISGQYLNTLTAQPAVEVAAVVDRDPGVAAVVASRLPAAGVMSAEELADDETIPLVLNLTVPAAHAEVTAAALAAGKHVYSEKPLATTLADGVRLVGLARSAGLRLGCAPDTVLGTGIQTARKVVDDGLIGTPVAAHAVMATAGHELWHPAPEFYYRAGGGPLLDMGPYYLSALVHLLGPVRRVTGFASRVRPQRTTATGPRAGSVIDAEVDTHEAALLVHEGGAISTLVMTFESPGSAAPPIEVFGTDGTLAVPDPNGFDGQAILRRSDVDGAEELAPQAGFSGTARGAGVLDLVRSLAAGRPHRASAELALHVLDVMAAIQGSAAADGAAIDIESACTRPEPVPLGPAR